MQPSHQEILDFWFGTPEDPQYRQPREAWFRKSDAFDAEIGQRFGALLEQVLGAATPAADPTQAWLGPPLQALPALARILLLDQFTRNHFRGTARAFAGDAQALALARGLVASGLDRELSGVQRSFVYLPFEHAEDGAHQRTALQLFTQLAADEPERTGLVGWAQKHHDVVARFGRFPHRNAILGRTSTAEEEAFLKTPGSSF